MRRTDRMRPWPIRCRRILPSPDVIGKERAAGAAPRQKGAASIPRRAKRSSLCSEMPRAAVHSGFVDFVFPPERIAEELAAIGKHPALTGSGPKDSADLDPVLERVLALLRTETGVDFSSYRKTTIRRRIRRRMVLHKIVGMEEYADFLKKKKEEEQR